MSVSPWPRGASGPTNHRAVCLFLLQTLAPPQVHATVFHPEQRTYSLAMVDLDAPDEEHATYQQWLHWLIEDIPLSATQTIVDEASILAAHGSKGRVVMPYIPPHPAQGSLKHRYATVLMTQFKAPENDPRRRKYNSQVASSAYPVAPPASEQAAAAGASPQQQVQSRDRFSVREYLAARGMDVAGLHFFREQWDHGEPSQAVSKVYRDILKVPEAIYEQKTHWHLPEEFVPPKA